jgi:hypothetical protein
VQRRCRILAAAILIASDLRGKPVALELQGSIYVPRSLELVRQQRQQGVRARTKSDSGFFLPNALTLLREGSKPKKGAKGTAGTGGVAAQARTTFESPVTLVTFMC